jgi:hypothetical protein
LNFREFVSSENSGKFKTKSEWQMKSQGPNFSIHQKKQNLPYPLLGKEGEARIMI